MQTVLTIAGFDPSSGAGVTADLMVFAAHRLYGTSAITALTVQSTLGVRETHSVAHEILAATLACLHEDLPPAGIKIGMLGTAANVAVVCDYLEAIRAAEGGERGRRIPVVLDPVLRSTSGRELLDAEGVEVLRSRLLPLVDWVTPNLAELAILSGQTVAAQDDLETAAKALQGRTVRMGNSVSLGVLATGGHLIPPNDVVLTPSGESTWLPGEHIASRSTHGTGCAHSSAFLSWLVLGESAVQAARAAKLYVAEGIRTAMPNGRGSSSINHLHPFHEVKIEV